jgi:hypothetical protein
VPVITGQLGAFIEKLPGYVSRLQTLAMDPNREWLRKIVGDGVADTQIGDIVKQGSGLDHGFPQVALVRRAGAHLDLLARGRDAGGRVLSAL